MGFSALGPVTDGTGKLGFSRQPWNSLPGAPSPLSSVRRGPGDEGAHWASHVPRGLSRVCGGRAF